MFTVFLPLSPSLTAAAAGPRAAVPARVATHLLRLSELPPGLALTVKRTLPKAEISIAGQDPWVQQDEPAPPDAAANDELGYSVALSADGSTALIGADLKNSSTGAAYVFSQHKGIWTEQQELAAHDGTAEGFGSAVALNGDGTIALVGAAGSETAYIFTKVGTSWTRAQVLSDGPLGYFGYAVALSRDGSVALVGASASRSVVFFVRSGSSWVNMEKVYDPDLGQFGHAVALSDDGATALIGASGSDTAVVYTEIGSTWDQQQQLTAGAAGGSMGYSVSLSGDGTTALIGAPYTSGGNGAAYVFSESNGAWSETKTLATSDGATNTYFGYAVALSGDGLTAAIGAYEVNNLAGVTYTYTGAGGSWTAQQILHAGDEVSTSGFGYAVALDSNGGVALVGAPFRNSSAGAAYIFMRMRGTWTQQQAEAGGQSDTRGTAVALSADGTTALVGAPGAGGGNGAAYLYTESNGVWTQAQTITGAVSDGHLGSAVALSGDGTTALIGADGEANYTGSAYLYAEGSGGWSQQATWSGPAQTSFFGDAVALSGDGATALVGAYGVNGSTGAVYVYTDTSGSWSQPQTLSGAGINDEFGYAVALNGNGTVALIGAEGVNLEGGAAYLYTKGSSGWNGQTLISSSTSGDEVGDAVALSSDGATAIIGANGANSGTGAAYVFTQSGGTWSQQAPLTGPGSSATFGSAVALNGNGTMAVIGSDGVVQFTGTAFMFADHNGSWAQQTTLTPSGGAASGGGFGEAVGLNTDGTVALVGAPYANSNAGAAYFFTSPGAPSAVGAQPGNGETGFTWSAPTSGNAGAVDLYTISLTGPQNPPSTYASGCSGSGDTETCTQTVQATSCTPTCVDSFTGLTDGQAYVAAVFAHDAAGNGPPLSIAGVTPYTVPDVPANVNAAPGYTSAVVTWDAPAFDGGRPITGYAVTCTPACPTVVIAYNTQYDATISNLAPDTPYTITVTAANAAGTGAGAQAGPVTPYGDATHFGVSAPATAVAGQSVAVTVTALDAGNVTVANYTGTISLSSTDAFAAAQPGGSLVTIPASYTYTASDAGSHVFAVALYTPGSQTVSAADTATPSLAGVSAAIAVSLQVPVARGWNLLDVPVQSTNLATAAGLVASMTQPGQIAGSITAVATYTDGAFSLYVPGYSPDVPLAEGQGVFVLSTAAGTWTPAGNAYPRGGQVTLQPGWNLVAAPAVYAGLTGDAINAEIGTGAPNGGCGLQDIAVYSGGAYATYLPPASGGGSGTPSGAAFMVPATAGAWIECTQPYTWSPA